MTTILIDTGEETNLAEIAPADAFDSVICTKTLQLTFDIADQKDNILCQQSTTATRG